ncbi:hypothetical protein BaRGS_00013898, partial [Batillaria attramentaria]
GSRQPACLTFTYSWCWSQVSQTTNFFTLPDFSHTASPDPQEEKLRIDSAVMPDSLLSRY